jgi:hypothetical protein
LLFLRIPQRIASAERSAPVLSVSAEDETLVMRLPVGKKVFADLFRAAVSGVFAPPLPEVAVFARVHEDS